MNFSCVDTRSASTVSKLGELIHTRPLRVNCDFFMEEIRTFLTPLLIQDTSILASLNVNYASGMIHDAFCKIVRRHDWELKFDALKGHNVAQIGIRPGEKECVEFPQLSQPPISESYLVASAVSQEIGESSLPLQHEISSHRSSVIEIDQDRQASIEANGQVLADEITINARLQRRNFGKFEESNLQLASRKYTKMVKIGANSILTDDEGLIRAFSTCAKAGSSDMTLLASTAENRDS